MPTASTEQCRSVIDDEEWLDTTATCRFFGGTKPIHPATLWRGVKAGRYPKPVKLGPNSNRWVRSECKAARAALIAAREQAAALAGA
jgi:predicted DNA-binding transcriptional regulator AlpA